MALFAQQAAEHELIELRDLAERLELHRHDPAVAAALQHIDPQRPTKGDRALLLLARDRLRSYLEYHRQFPFRVVPPATLQPGILLGTQRANRLPITITTEHLTRHLLIAAGTGFGKTTLIRQVLRQLHTLGIKRFTIDRKDDTRRNAIDDPDCLILHSGARYNPLHKPAFVSLPEHLTLFVQCFARSFFGGEHLKQAFTEVLQQAFSEQATPCLADVAPIVERLLQKATTFTRRDALQGLLLRLQRFALVYPTPFATRRGIGAEELLRHSLHLPISLQSEPDDFLFTLLVHHLFLYQRSRQARNDLEYVIVIDEALHLWQARANNIEHQPLLSMLQSMVREFGIGLIVATTSLQVIDPILKANVFAQIAMNMTNHFESSEVARTFGFTTEEQSYFSAKLQRGECIIKLADGWRYPILASFPPDHESKDVHDEEWRGALERINTIAPTEPVAEILAAREGIEGTRQPTPPHESAPSSSPPARVAPVVEHDEQEIPPNAGRRLALNKHAAALLADAGDHPFTLTTAAYDRCKMHWTQGDRAKQLNLKLGILNAHNVKTGAGRGKTGSALEVTPTGWDWLGRKPTKGTRGGDSVQHAFLVHELSRRIAKSSIETLGADLVIPYNTHDHQALFRALGELASQDITLNEGAIIALECEVSAPAKTVPRNVQRDAGFELTIIATLPKHLTLASRLIARNERVVVVDALRLLDALRTTEER